MFKNEIDDDDYITYARFLGSKCYYYQTYKGKGESKLKGLQKEYFKNMGIDSDVLFDEMQRTGVSSANTTQWVKNLGSVGIINIEKSFRVVLRRKVEQDGDTEPFKDEEEFIQYHSSSLADPYNSNRFIYI